MNFSYSYSYRHRDSDEYSYIYSTGYNSTGYNNTELENTDTAYCYTSWIHDEWCDALCNVERCNFDDNYCSECSGSCQTALNWITLLAGIQDPLEFVTEEEVCEYWSLLTSNSNAEDW